MKYLKHTCFILVFFITFHSSAQIFPKEESVNILLKNNRQLNASVLEETADSLKLVTRYFEYTISKSDIKLAELKDCYYKNGEVWRKDKFSEHSLIQSFSDRLEKGELIYGNSDLLFHHVNYGLSSRLSLNTAFLYIPAAGQMLVVQPSYNFTIDEKTDLKIGILHRTLAYAYWEEHPEIGGIIHTNLITSGSPLSKLNFGFGIDYKILVGYATPKKIRLAENIYMSTAYSVQISKKKKIFTEAILKKPVVYMDNGNSEESLTLSAGIRTISKKKHYFAFGLISSLYRESYSFEKKYSKIRAQIGPLVSYKIKIKK